MKGKYPINIVITGPESTGKTELSQHLAKIFNGRFVPEYAREYIQNLGRRYNYEDVLKIARMQIQQQNEVSTRFKGFIFYDTWLIITKIWLKEVYGRYPDWIDEKLENIRMDLYLLCAADIPWIPDPLRENGGERRDYLFEQYRGEIMKLGIKYYIISGTGEERFYLAENLIKKHFELE